jgi:peptidoglycan/xylan/chitin deacetylase (PgdA/CDA1 family)
MTIGKKDLLANLLVHTRLMGVVGGLHHMVHRDLKVLAYHRVLPRSYEAGFPYDMELVSAWADEFDWQMQYLSRNYRVINSHDLLAFIDSGTWPDQPCAMVTFDDGYVDNHDIVLPILKRHGLTAVIFVSTGYVGSGQTFWYDQLAYEVLHTSVSQLSLEPGGAKLDLGVTETQRREVLDKLLRHLKAVSNDVRISTLAQWRAEMGSLVDVDLPNSLHRPMNWDEVKALSDAGIEIGSHTVSHPVLPRVTDPAQLESEMVDSKAELEARLGKPVLSFAYPTGGPGAYSKPVIECAERAGYRLAFTYRGGLNQRDSWHAYLVRRLAIERYISRERFQASLAAPTFF